MIFYKHKFRCFINVQKCFIKLLKYVLYACIHKNNPTNILYMFFFFFFLMRRGIGMQHNFIFPSTLSLFSLLSFLSFPQSINTTKQSIHINSRHKCSWVFTHYCLIFSQLNRQHNCYLDSILYYLFFLFPSRMCAPIHKGMTQLLTI